jgi:hypothetical protein
MVSLRTHNILDYVGAATLVLAPFVFGFADVAAARNVFLVLGIGLACYSLITNYRYSIAKIIPLGVHMALDVSAGVVMMLAPSIFGYRADITGGQYALHFILGLGVIGLVAMTRRKTDMAPMGMTTSYTASGEVDRDRRRAA